MPFDLIITFLGTHLKVMHLKMKKKSLMKKYVQWRGLQDENGKQENLNHTGGSILQNPVLCDD